MFQMGDAMPETRYAKTDDGVSIAYEVVGQGPIDVVYANSFMSHVEVSWEYPRAARFYERMAEFCRLVLFDRRGTGLSDPIVDHFTLDDRVSDLRAVLDAVGADRPVLLGSSEGAAACATFAALHPDRVASLVLFSPALVPVADDECPWAWTPEFFELVLATFDDAWSNGTGIEFINPSLAQDSDARSWYARYFRMSASPGLARALLRHNKGAMDVRQLLASISVPTLLLHRTDEAWISVEQSRYAARKVPGARLVELPGTDHYIWEQDIQVVIEEIEEFVTGVRPERRADRFLTTLVFTDIVQSTDRAHALGDARWTELLDRQEAAAARQLARFGGQLIKGTGDGALAIFPSPARAIRCALAIREASRGLGLELRAGIHTGEVERRGDDLGGIAVHLAARVAASAQPNEVLISRTVADLVAGSDLHLTDRGEYALKGIPDARRLYAAEI